MRLKNHTKRALEAGNLRIRPGDPIEVTEEQLADHSKLPEFRAWLSKGDLSIIPDCHEAEIEARAKKAAVDKALADALAKKAALDADEKAAEDDREAAWKALPALKDAAQKAADDLNAILHPPPKAEFSKG